MRPTKRFLALLFTGLMMFSGIAMASPPEDDPTCDNPGGPASGQECAGDNGAPGCEGVQRAEELAPEQAEPAFDLVTDILSEGAEGDCDDSERPGGQP